MKKVKKNEVFTHGDSSQKKNQMNLRGHIFNHETGCLETIDSSGSVVREIPLLPPSKIKKQYAVGTTSSLKMDYNNVPTKWTQGFGIIYPNKGK